MCRSNHRSQYTSICTLPCLLLPSTYAMSAVSKPFYNINITIYQYLRPCNLLHFWKLKSQKYSIFMKHWWCQIHHTGSHSCRAHCPFRSLDTGYPHPEQYLQANVGVMEWVCQLHVSWTLLDYNLTIYSYAFYTGLQFSKQHWILILTFYLNLDHGWAQNRGIMLKQFKNRVDCTLQQPHTRTPFRPNRTSEM